MLIKTILFVSIIGYSILLQKRTPLTETYLYEIDTGPVTYPIDARRRRTSIHALSHTPRDERTPNAVLSHTGISSHIARNSSNKNIRKLLYLGITISYIKIEVGILASQRVVRPCEVNWYWWFEIHRQLTTDTTQHDYSSYFLNYLECLSFGVWQILCIYTRRQAIDRINIAQPSEAWHAVFSQCDCCKAALPSSHIAPSSNSPLSNIPNLPQRYTTWM